MSTANYKHEICDNVTYLQGLEEAFGSSGALTTWFLICVSNFHGYDEKRFTAGWALMDLELLVAVHRQPEMVS